MKELDDLIAALEVLQRQVQDLDAAERKRHDAVIERIESVGKSLRFVAGSVA